MASSNDKSEAAARQQDAPRIEAPAERLFALMSGHFAGGYDAAAARLAMDRKRRTWLERQGRLDPAARQAMEARIAAGDREAGARLDDLARSVAAAVPEAGTAIVSGRVLKDGIGQPGLTVSAVERRGKALACAETGGGGTFRFAVDGAEEAVLTVSDAKGATLLADDRVLRIERGTAAYREIDLSGGRRPCPDGPDLSARKVMPDLVGWPLEKARAEARGRGIEIARIEVRESEAAQHTVLATDPPAGRLLADPARCELVISTRADRATAVDTVAAVMKAQDTIKVSDQLVDRLVTGLKNEKTAGRDALEKLARATDRAFAAATGVAREEAKLVRQSLAAILKQLGGKKKD
ncbi:MAG: PASTA domain-containing protein [Allosphingosinicella sp.]